MRGCACMAYTRSHLHYQPLLGHLLNKDKGHSQERKREGKGGGLNHCPQKQSNGMETGRLFSFKMNPQFPSAGRF